MRRVKCFGMSGRAMVERMLTRKSEPVDHDSLIAAAHDFVACCEGSTDDAFDVLEAYTELSGSQAGSTACARVAERAQEARVFPS